MISSLSFNKKNLQIFYNYQIYRLFSESNSSRHSHFIRRKPGIHWWKNEENQKNFLERVSKHLKIENWKDWYQIEISTIKKLGGFGLLSLNKDSLYEALKKSYPEYDWKPWKFINGVENLWGDISIQKDYFDCLMKEMNLTSWEDWYKVGNLEFLEKGGSHIINYYYSGSPMKALTTLYPENPWKAWKFNRVPKGYWKDPENVKEIVKYVSKDLSIKSIEDWYKVSIEQFDSAVGVIGALNRIGGMSELFKIIYPEFEFDRTKFQVKKNQIKMYSLVKELFPSIEVNWESRLHLDNSSMRSIELDVFIPSLSLGFEYQGIQHFRDTNRLSISEAQKLRDKNKRRLCILSNITLIEIPYWWSASKSNLALEIRKVRPDLLKDFKIEEMKAPGILDIKDFKNTIYTDPTDLKSASNWDVDINSDSNIFKVNKKEIT